jgi:hypothetical protein
VARLARGATLAMEQIALMMFSEMGFFVLDLCAPIMPGERLGISKDITEAIIEVSEVITSIDDSLIHMFDVIICLEIVLISAVSMMRKNI